MEQLVKNIFTVLSFCFLLTSCSSKPILDLSDTKLFIYPSRVFVPAAETNYQLTEKHRAKAKIAAKKRKYDILYEVYINKDGTARSVKLVTKTRYADNETVAKVRHQISKKGFFNTFGANSAFFYGVVVRTEVEYM